MVFIICLLGSVIQGVIGFGFAMFVMAFLPLLMPLKLASAITSLYVLFIGSMMSYNLRKNIDFKMVIVPIITSFIFIPAGVYLLLICRENILTKILGGLIVLLAIFLFINGRRKINIKPSLKNGIAVGTISGIMSGMFNVGGPPLVLYYLHAAKDNLSYKASLEFTFAVNTTFVFLSHIFYGNVSGNMLELALIGFVATVSGSFLGLKVFRKLDAVILTWSVYVMMFIMGFVLLLK